MYNFVNFLDFGNTNFMLRFYKVLKMSRSSIQLGVHIIFNINNFVASVQSNKLWLFSAILLFYHNFFYITVIARLIYNAASKLNHNQQHYSNIQYYYQLTYLKPYTSAANTSDYRCVRTLDHRKQLLKPIPGKRPVVLSNMQSLKLETKITLNIVPTNLLSIYFKTTLLVPFWNLIEVVYCHHILA